MWGMEGGGGFGVTLPFALLYCFGTNVDEAKACSEASKGGDSQKQAP